MRKAILLTEWKAFYRNNIQVFFYLLLFFIGLYAIHYGYKEVERQNEVIAFVKAEEDRQFENTLKGFSADTTKPEGKRLFHEVAEPRYARLGHRYNTIFYPSSLAGLSLGQRDVFPYYHKLNSHSLYMQVFKNELVNPQKLLAGNLDISFIIVFLFPLLIIAFCYGLVSTEIENGTYSVLKTQPVAFSKIIFLKVSFRYLLTFALATLLCVDAFIYAGVPVQAALLWLLIVSLYLGFWHGVAFCIASLQKNSASNAMSLLALWLLFLVVLPSLTNAVSIYKYPVNPTHLSNGIRRIQLEETKDGLFKVASAFYQQYPWYNDRDTSMENLYKKGYAMAGIMGDEKAKSGVVRYYAQIRNRDGWTSQFNLISPAVQTQQLFNYLACTDITNYLNYHEEVERFHKRLVRFYVHPFLLNRQLSVKDYQHKPSFRWLPSVSYSRIGIGISFLAIWTALLWVGAHFILKRSN